MIARRYDKAFFLRVEPTKSLELKKEHNIKSNKDYPKVILYRHFDDNYVVFDKEWNARNLERWIV